MLRREKPSTRSVPSLASARNCRNIVLVAAKLLPMAMITETTMPGSAWCAPAGRLPLVILFSGDAVNSAADHY